MNLNEILNNLRGSHASSEITSALIEVAAIMKADNSTHDELPAMEGFARSGTAPLLKLAAQNLLQLSPDQRLSKLSDMLDRSASREFGEFWIRHDAALELIGLIKGAQSVRFSYGCSIHPALLFALEQQRHSQPVLIEYAGWGADVQFLEKMASILGVDIAIAIEREKPWVRTKPSDSEFEIIMPPFGADMARAGDVPEATLSWLGISGEKHGRLFSESVAIADALQNAKGRVILAIGEGALFRAVGVEAIAREELVRSGRLQTVMGLGPGMMFQNTAINTALLLLSEEHERHDKVRFINLAHDDLAIRRERGRLDIRKETVWADLPAMELTSEEAFARDVDVESIKAEGYSLTIDRYLDRHARVAIQAILAKSHSEELADLVEIVRPVALTQQEDGEYTILEAAPADIGERGYVTRPSREITVDRVSYRKAFNQQLRPGDVLISFKGTVGKVGLVAEGVPSEGASTIWTAGQSLMILRLKGKHQISPLVLFEYLSNDVVQEHIKSLAGGAAIQTLAMKDLKGFAIPLPDKETQDDMQAAFTKRQEIHDQIEQLKTAITEKQQSSWPHTELRLLRD